MRALLLFQSTIICCCLSSGVSYNTPIEECIMGNQGKMAGNSKICIRIQSPLFLPEFMFDAFSLKRVTYEFKETIQ